MCSWKGSAEIREEAFIYWTVFFGFYLQDSFFKKNKGEEMPFIKKKRILHPFSQSPRRGHSNS
jgi:hypothetical protein